MEKRDEQGRFVKGNKEGKKFVKGGQQSEIGRAGGKASVKAKKERKDFKKWLDEFMNMDVKNKEGEALPAIAVVALDFRNQMMKGNLKALKMYLQLNGDLINKTEVTGKDGKDLIPDDKDKLMAELERLKSATE